MYTLKYLRVRQKRCIFLYKHILKFVSTRVIYEVLLTSITSLGGKSLGTLPTIRCDNKYPLLFQIIIFYPSSKFHRFSMLSIILT